MVTSGMDVADGRCRHHRSMAHKWMSEHTPNNRTGRPATGATAIQTRSNRIMSVIVEPTRSPSPETPPAIRENLSARPPRAAAAVKMSKSTCFLPDRRGTSPGLSTRPLQTFCRFSIPESQDLTVVGSISVVTRTNRVSPHFERCPPRTAWMRRQPR